MGRSLFAVETLSVRLICSCVAVSCNQALIAAGLGASLN